MDKLKGYSKDRINPGKKLALLFFVAAALLSSCNVLIENKKSTPTPVPTTDCNSAAKPYLFAKAQHFAECAIQRLRSTATP